ncbi:MAG: exosortase/archaeosortase family protein [Isosphaeraceae bacterium]
MAALPEAPVPNIPSDADPWILARLVVRPATDPEQRLQWLGAWLCLGLFALVFWDSLGHFYYAWTTDENYSHGFLVPLISLYFANQVARRGPTPARGGGWLGGSMLVSALVVRLLTTQMPVPFVEALAFLVALAGMFTLLYGTSALKSYWFAFFFLVFMVPLPVELYSKIASPLQLLASQVASSVMNATGVPVLREGNRMTLPGGVQMFVAEACSGMRQLTGFLALTTAVVYVWSRPWWYRVAIVFSALPIALSANIARVVLTGYIMHFLTPQFASGAFHTGEGLLMMGFGLLMLNCECWILDLISRCLDTKAPKPPARAVPLGYS